MIDPKIIIDAHLREFCRTRELSVLAEFKFHPDRKWRFDWAIVPARVAVEFDGGIFTGGRHVNPHGYTKDAEKINEAQLLGWRVYRITPLMMRADAHETLGMLDVAILRGLEEARRVA